MSVRVRGATSSDEPCGALARIVAQVQRRGRKRKMVHRDFRSARIMALVAAVVATLAFSAPSFAAGMAEEDVPSTSIVPAEGPSGAAPVNSPSSVTSPSTSGKTFRPAPKGLKPVHHASSRSSAREPEIEPAQAKLKVLQASPVYASPAKSSKHVEQLTPGKFVEVTGSTHYYLQVKLKSGQTGYIDPSAVELGRTTDKVFMFTHDAIGLDNPNRW